MGLLAAGVAHEVNTPLTGISSYTQMLLDDIPPGDLRRSLLEKIEAQTRRASGIANSLLNLARPDRNAFEPFDLSEAVAEVIRLFEPQVRGRGIRVVSDLDERIPEVVGNRSKIRFKFKCLCINKAYSVGPHETWYRIVDFRLFDGFVGSEITLTHSVIGIDQARAKSFTVDESNQDF